MSTNGLRVVIAQYHSGNGPHGVRPYQWHLCIETGRDRRGFVEATVFYIRGSSAGGFVFEWRAGARYKMPGEYRGSVAVGVINPAMYHDAMVLMQEVETRDRSAYAAQSWAYAAARKLSAHGLMGELWAQEYVERQLRHAEAAWERGDD